MKLKCLLLSVVFIFTCLFTGCGDNKAPHKVTGIYFDTVVELTVFGEKVPEEALELCEKYDKLFSKTNPESEIHRLNQSHSLEVSDETLELIKTALFFCEEGRGIFDITMEPVIKLWDFSAENPTLPDPKEVLYAANNKVDYRAVKIEGNRVTLEKEGGIDLGGIAKGYIADKIAELYREKGLSGIINLGGNIITVGEKTDGERFKVGVKKPFTDSDTVCTLEITQAAVATSGVYERYFKLDGEIYHHLLNRKGWPENKSLQAVTVIHENATTADALSTILYLFNEYTTLLYLEEHPEVQAVFVYSDGEVKFSPGFKDFDRVKVRIENYKELPKINHQAVPETTVVH